MATITRPAALVRQGSLKLYTTSLRVADLAIPNFFQITKLDPEEEGPGYQRLLNQKRANRLSEYLLEGLEEGDAFLPTSIFLATHKDIAFDEQTNSITFDTVATGPFNVVDGQHRIAGLIQAASENQELLHFEVPANIAVGLDDVSQMCHFLIVNTTQRSVDKAVEQQIVARLTRKLELEDMPTIPKWIRRQVHRGEDAKALEITTFLNCDSNSPWRGKIRMANEELDSDSTINQKSFVTSIKKYILSASNPLSSSAYDTKRNQILANYWRAVIELLVDATSDRPSVVFKTIGVDFFHIVSTTVFLHLANQRDYRKEVISQVLRRGFDNLPSDAAGLAHPEWWQRGGAASGINAGAVRKLASTLSHAINAPASATGITV